MSNLDVCRRCIIKQRMACAVCVCPFDAAGRKIEDHAENGDCPNDYFNHPERMKDIKPVPLTIDGVTITPPPPKPIDPIPRDRWPKWAKAIAFARADADKGVGDTTQRMVAKIGGEKYKAFMAKIGAPCGCTTRQHEWNSLYPYCSPGE